MAGADSETARDVAFEGLSRRRATSRFSPLIVYGVGFVLMLAAAGALAFAQFRSGPLAPWLSIGGSAMAVACGIASVFRKRGR